MQYQIKNLPGADKLLSKQYSGFLNVTDSRHMHFYYIESESNPNTDSIIFWTNGGPGCSGFLGLFSEMGPWRPLADGKLISNPYSWTKLANMVFLEQPIGVGYSYSKAEGPDGIITDDIVGDYNAVSEMVLAIERFFDLYPERRKNKEIYIASESYGGHYIPELTLALLNHKVADTPSQLNENKIRERFNGYIVGNPFTSFSSGSLSGIVTGWNQQLAPKPLWDEYKAANCDDLSLNFYNFPDKCFELLEKLDEITSSAHLNPYALTFPTCGLPNPLGTDDGGLETAELHSVVNKHSRRRSAQSEQLLSMLKRHRKALNAQASISKESHISNAPARNLKSDYPDPGLLPYNPCTENWAADYINREDVRKAMNVYTDTDQGPALMTIPWHECSNYVWQYWPLSDMVADTTDLYSAILEELHSPLLLQESSNGDDIVVDRSGFKMLVFSGDVDGVCSTLGSQYWIYNVTGDLVLQKFKDKEFRSFAHTPKVYWRQWNAYDDAAGYYTLIKSNQGNVLAFATVHDAGHEVPAYQPERAFVLFKSYMDGSLFDETPPGEVSTFGYTGTTSRKLTDLEGFLSVKQLQDASLPIPLSFLLFVTSIVTYFVMRTFASRKA